MFDDLNKAAATSGGRFIKVNRKEHGVLKGIVLDIERRDRTYEGQVVLNRKTGKPRDSYVITLLTELRDPEIDDDDGVRMFDANESAWRAISTAVREAKATAEVGDTLTLKVENDPPSSNSQADYRAKWEKGPGVPKEFAGVGAATSYADDEEPF